VRTGVRNFFLNLEEPVTIVNDVLQGKFLQAGKDTTRFLINSTLGLAGLIDIASDLNLAKHDEDFGQTFAVWGIGSGPHIELPFLGPSNLRDGIGLVGEIVYLDPIDDAVRSKTEYTLKLVELIDLRAQFLGTEKVLDQQLDPYLFVRDGYRQRRRNLIYDGNPPLEDDAFFDEDELFEDDDQSP
jgi:phospholipid-binding lipoprotein MlaA